MSDCTNVEMRELLPDLVSGRISAVDKARVSTHVEECSDCKAELELLSSVRSAVEEMAPAYPSTSEIVAALPRPQKIRKLPVKAPHRAWRVAAAVTAIALGGVSLTVLRQYAGGPGIDSARVRDTGALVAIADSPTAADVARLTAGLGTMDLADEDLEALIGALDRIEAAPTEDPESNRLGRMVASATGGD